MEGGPDKRIFNSSTAAYIDQDGYYVYNLSSALSNVRSIELFSAIIPNVFNNISESLNNNTIVVNGIQVIIPDGIYTASSLVNVMQTEFLSQAGQTYTITFDITTGKFTFTNTTAALNLQTVGETSTLLGFDILVSAISTPIEATWPMDLGVNKNIIIDISYCNQGVSSNENIIGQYNIPVNVNAFDTISYNRYNNFPNVISLPEGLIYFPSIRIRILDQYGQLFINNYSFLLTLLFKKNYM